MIDVPKMYVQYEGLFDFDNLYASIIDWAKNYGYLWHEKAYKHKVPSPKGAEQEFDWVLTKEVTEYVNYKITIGAHAYDLMEVEVNIDGKKKILSNARIDFVIEGSFDLDWQKKFKNNSRFVKWLKKWHDKGLIAENMYHHDLLYYRMINLQTIIKKYFDMQSKQNSYKRMLQEE